MKMKNNNLGRFARSAFIALALIIGIPGSAQAEEVSITSISGKDADYVSYSGDTWTVSICDKSKIAKKGYVQVKSGKKWKKLSKVSKSKTTKDISQCQEEYPYLTEFTYSETKVGSKSYRVNVPGKSGYKIDFTAVKDPYTGIDGGGTIGLSPSKLQDCYFKNKKLAGSVYFSNSQFGSDFTVYESNSSLGSDLSVYLDSSSTFASIATCGQWHTVSSSWQANFTVYRTSSPLFADLVINYVPFSWTAGQN
jgi:hypothetical protein